MISGLIAERDVPAGDVPIRQFRRDLDVAFASGDEVGVFNQREARFCDAVSYGSELSLRAAAGCAGGDSQNAAAALQSRASGPV